MWPQSCKMMLGPGCKGGLYLCASCSEPSPHPRPSPWRTSWVIFLQRVARKNCLIINLFSSLRPPWIQLGAEICLPYVGSFPLTSHKHTDTEAWTGTPLAFRAFLSSTNPTKWVLGKPRGRGTLLVLVQPCQVHLVPSLPTNSTKARMASPTLIGAMAMEPLLNLSLTKCPPSSSFQ